jgi:hypothetical protein
MKITINNVKQICQESFENIIYDNYQSLVVLDNFFKEQKNPLGNMIHDEFNFYWNDFFSKHLLEHSFLMPFPSFVKPSLSVWLLNWKDYIENKYSNDYFSPSMTVREMKMQDFQDEVDKLLEFFKLSEQKLSQINFNSIENGLKLHIPISYNKELKNYSNFKDGFISSVFYLAKIKFFNKDSINKNDLKNFFRSYYSCFYEGFNEERKNIFNTYCFPNIDYVKAMEEKIKFLQPKNIEEQYLFYHLDVPSLSFAKALNEVVGLKEYVKTGKEDYAIKELQKFFTSLKVQTLEDKFKLHNNIKSKKIKI